MHTAFLALLTCSPLHSAAIDECHALWVSKGLLKPTAAKPKLTFIIVGKG